MNVSKGSHLFALPNAYLASQDAIEVMFVSDWVTDWGIVCTYFTDVILVSEDTYGDEDEDEEYE